jgi:hypothetical protein
MNTANHKQCTTAPGVRALGGGMWFACVGMRFPVFLSPALSGGISTL